MVWTQAGSQQNGFAEPENAFADLYPAAARGLPAGSSHALSVVPISELKPYKGNARTHSRKQVRQIADSIKRFGFNNPVLVDDDGMIIAGHGRVEAAKLLGLAAVPTLRLSHLSDAEKRAYVIADNKLAEKAGWNREILAIELQALVDLDFAVELTGIEISEIELLLDDGDKAERDGSGPDLPAVSLPGDSWILGHHELICGGTVEDSREVEYLIKRWQTSTGKSATLAATGQSFEEVKRVRTRQVSSPSLIADNDAAATEEVR